MSETSPVITRFAPSPTGHLHIGGVRTALFCWAYARRHGGIFLLRIEDTDQARSSEASARGILEDLAWCGILWDEGPAHPGDPGGGGGQVGERDARGVGSFYQSKRLPLYNAVIDEMIERDLAYPAFDTSAELDARRKAAADKKETFRYKRGGDYDRARGLARMRAGEACVIRFNNPGDVVKVADEVLGDIKFEPEHTDDFVLRKADGFPTYHFAVVVDDEKMGVTHVMRGQEHLNNTPRHVALQRALGYRVPKFAHLPLIFNPDSTKMSKRDKDKAAREAVKKQSLSADTLGPAVLGDVTPEQFEQWLGDKTRQLPGDTLRRVAGRTAITLPEIDVDDFRRSGYLPEVLCNYVALLGWNPGMKTPDGKDLEKFDREFLSRHFDTDRIGKTNSKFDRVKLASFNQDAIAPPPTGLLTDAEFAGLWRAWCEEFEPGLPERMRPLAGGPDRFVILAGAVRARAKTLREAVNAAAFVMLDDASIVYDPKAVEKALNKPLPAPNESLRGRDLLGEARDVLAQIPEAGFTPAAVHGALEALAGARLGAGAQVGPIAQALRVAVTGTGVSPGINETLAALGKQSVLARIGHALRSTTTASPQ